MQVACLMMAERKLNGPAPPSVRCFVASLVVADSARRLRDAFLQCCPGIVLTPSGPAPRRAAARLVPLANFHVTLKFLGQVPATALAGLAEQVAALGAEPVTAEVICYAGLPRPDQAQAVVAELAPHPQLEAWKHALEQRLGGETRPFRPHVTMVRCRRRTAFAAIAVEHPLLLQLEAPRLFRSDQIAGGMRYTAISGGPAAP